MKTSSNRFIILCLFLCMSNIVSFSQNHYLSWAGKFTGADLNYTNCKVVTDSKGNIFIAGTAKDQGTALDFKLFSTYGMNPHITNQAFIAKYAPNGTFINYWLLAGENSGITDIYMVQDHLYIAGYFTGEYMNFNPAGTPYKLNASNGKLFFGMYDAATMQMSWVYNIGNTYDSKITRIRLGISDGSVFISGYYRGGGFSLDKTNTKFLPSPQGQYDIFFAKYKYSGTCVWYKTIGSTENDSAFLDIDCNNNVYLSGTFGGSLANISANFDPKGSTYLTSSLNNNSFLCKFDSAGNFKNARKLGGICGEVTTTACGEVVVYGQYYGNNSKAVFDTVSNFGFTSSSIYKRGFVAKYGENCNFQWARNFGIDDGYDDNVSSVAYSPNNLVVFWNNGNSYAQYNKLVEANGLNLDSFMITSPNIKPVNVYVNNADNFILSGKLQTTTDLNPSTTLVTNVNAGYFVAKYFQGSPTFQETSLKAELKRDTMISFNWERGSGDSVIMFACQGIPSAPALSNNMQFIHNSRFGYGTQNGLWFCVYKGKENKAVVTGLSANTNYNFYVAGFNSDGQNILYNNTFGIGDTIKTKTSSWQNTISLNGTNQFIKIPTQNLTGTTGYEDFTVETWFRSWDSNGSIINNNKTGKNYYSLGFSGGYFQVKYAGDSLFSRQLIKPGTLYDSWNHVAMVRQGASLKIYINGNLELAENVNIYKINVTDTTFIGQERYADYYYGNVDETRIWKRALTENEIKNGLFSTPNLNDPDLSLYLNYNQQVTNNVTNIKTSEVYTIVNNASIEGSAAQMVPFFSTPVNGSNGFRLSWSKIPGVFCYTLERADNAAFDLRDSIKSVYDTTYFFYSDEGSLNYYRINASIPNVNSKRIDHFVRPMTIPGNALQFDGVDDWVFCNGNPSYVTAEAWVKPTRGTGIQAILSSLRESPTYGGFELALVDSTPRLAVYDLNKSAYVYLNSPVSIPLFQWSHLAIIATGTRIALYVNGTLVKDSVGINRDINGATALNLGRSSLGGNFYKGQLDEVRVWYTERSSQEILDNLHKTVDPESTNLHYYYRFDRLPSTTDIDDLSIYHLNGSPNNMDAQNMWVPSGALTMPFIRIREIKNKEIKISWDSIPGALLYTVFYEGQGHNVFNSNSHSLINLTPNTTYNIALYAHLNTGTSETYYENIKTANFKVDSVQSDSVKCKNGSDGKLRVFISGGIAPFTYKLYDYSNILIDTKTSANNTIEFQNLNATRLYYVDVIDSKDNETKFENIPIYEPNPNINFLNQSIADVCPVEPLTQEVIIEGLQGTISYNWHGENLNFTSTNEQLTTITGNLPGYYTYTVDVIYNNVCTLSVNNSINVKDVPTINLGSDVIVKGDTNYVISSYICNNCSTYLWTSTGSEAISINDPSSAYPSFHGSDSKTYKVALLNTNSCGSSSDTMSISFIHDPLKDSLELWLPIVSYGSYNDASGKNRNVYSPASVMDINYSQDRFNNGFAISPNTSMGYLMASSLAGHIRDSLSVSFWIKPSVNNVKQTIFYAQNSFSLYLDESKRIVAYDDSSNQSITSNKSLPLYTWSHVTWTKDNNGVQKIYIDAIQDVQHTMTNNKLKSQNSNISILGEYDGNLASNVAIKTSIDEFRVYSRDLKQSEIDSLYYKPEFASFNKMMDTIPGTEGVTKSYTINSNRSWAITQKPSWVTLNKMSGTGNDVISITAQANWDNYTRGIESHEAILINGKFPGLQIRQLPILKTGLVAEYQLYGNANDMTSNYNHGSTSANINFPLLTPRYCASFSEPSSITVPVSSSLNFNGEFTINFFVRIDNVPTKTAKFFRKGDIYAGVNAGDFKNNSSYGQANANIIELNKWVNLTYINSGGSTKIYSNGNLVSQGTHSPNWTSVNDSALYFGEDLTGYMDEIKIYNRALSEEEIKAIIVAKLNLGKDSFNITGTMFNLSSNSQNGNEVKRTWYFASNSPHVDANISVSEMVRLLNAKPGHTYYVVCKDSSDCGYYVTDTIKLGFFKPSMPSGPATQKFCSSSNPKVADLAVTGTNLIWFNNLKSRITADTLLKNGGIYHVISEDKGVSSDTLHINVVIDQLSKGGSIGGGSPLCPNQNSNILVLSGNIGNIQKWQTSTDKTTWTDKPITIAQYPPSTYTQNTWFRVIVKNGVCPEVNSKLDSVIINPEPAAPTGLDTQVFCVYSNPKVSNLSVSGTNINWYKVNTGGVPIVDTFLVNGNAYYASQTSALGCQSTSRFKVIARIDAATVPGSISGNPLVCPSTTTTINLTGNTGVVTKWVYSIDTSTSWTTDVKNSLSYTTAALTQKTWYKAFVKNGICPGIYTNALAVDVNTFSPAPTANSSQSFCIADGATVANLNATGTNIKWYDAATNGSVFTTTTALSNGSTYYASQNSTGCESNTRTPVIVAIKNCTGPILANNTISISENAPINSVIYDFNDGNTGIDMDNDGNNLLYTIISSNTSLFSINTNTGIITLAEATAMDYESYISHNITVRATNGTITSDATVTVNLKNVNDNAPIAIADTFQVNEGATLNISMLNGVLKNDYENDGDSVEVLKVSDPLHGSFSLSSDGSFTYIHDGSETTADSFKYKLYDGTFYGNIVTVRINISPVNDAPIVSNFIKSGNEDVIVSFAKSDFANAYADAESNPLAKIKITQLPIHSTLKLLGSFVVINQEIPASQIDSLKLIPNVNWFGSDSIKWNASDGLIYAIKDCKTTINIAAVNDLPVISDISNSGVKNSILVFGKNVFNAAFYDIDANSMAFVKITSLPTKGMLKLFGSNISLNQEIPASQLDSLKLFPNFNWSGVDSFYWNASDGISYALNNVKAFININATNDLPILSNISKIGSEDVVVTFTKSDFTSAFYDVDANAIASIKIISLPANASLKLYGINVSLNQEILASQLDSLKLYPNSNWFGKDSLTWNASDGFGFAIKDAKIILNINAVNDLPLISNITKSGIRDAVVSFNKNDFSAAFYDIEASNLTFIKIKSLPTNGSLKLLGTAISLNQEIPSSQLDSLKFIPNANWFGVDSIIWNATDGTDYAIKDAKAIINIASANELPTISSITKTGNEDNVLILGKSDFISGFTDKDGNALAFVKITSLPTKGNLKFYGSNVTVNQEIIASQLDSLKFSPNANWFGSDSISWNASDGFGYAIKDAKAMITINAINDVPVISNITKSGSEDAILSFGKTDFSAVFSDIEANTLASVKITSLPNKGTLKLFGINVSLNQEILASQLDSLKLLPNTNWFGKDTLSWNASDGLAYANADAKLIIQLNPVNDAPVINSNGGGTIASVNVTENTTAVTTVTAYDVDLPAQKLTYSISGLDAAFFNIDSLSGILSFKTAPNYESPADAGNNNVYDLIVKVTDEGLLSGSQSLAVYVMNSNESPTLANQTVTIAENSLIGTMVAKMVASDPEKDTLIWEISTGNNGKYSINSQGIVSLVKSLDFETDYRDTLTIKVTDIGKLTATASLIINISDVNEPPYLADKTVQILENMKAGFVATNVKAVNPEKNELLYYEIILSDLPGAFGIEPISGDIFVSDNTLLDYEKVKQVNLLVLVTDNGLGKLTDTAVVTFNLVDVYEPLFYADFTFDAQNLKVKFKSNSAKEATKLFWIFNDGATYIGDSTVHTYKISGNYNVCLTAVDEVNSLSHRICKKVEVGSPACNIQASFVNIPNDKTIQFINQSSENAKFFYWSFGDDQVSYEKSPVHSYQKDGYYIVTLASTDSAKMCTDYYYNVVVAGRLDCRASFDFMVNTKTVNFINNSVGNIAIYNWDYGDGSISNKKEDNHTYLYDGQYRVTLTVLNTLGSCLDVYSMPVQIGTNSCTADFSYTVDSASTKVNFNNKVVGESTKLTWYFGDGSVSTELNPKHTYNYPGYYNVGLSTLNINFNPTCIDYIEKPILVGNEDVDCEAAFAYSVDHANRTAKFTDKSRGNIESYLWNFGDKNISNGQTTEHIYGEAGYFNVCLTVVNRAKISNISCQRIGIDVNTKEDCNADFNFMPMTGNEVAFVDKSLGKPSSWLWDFGDISTSILKNPKHVYSVKTNYLASLKIQNSTGCLSKTYKLVGLDINKGIKVMFGADPDTLKRKAGGYPVDFVGAGTGDQARLRWDFGDGSPVDSTTSTPNHSYLNDGSYYVCLTVSDPVTGDSTVYCDSVIVATKSGTKVALIEGSSFNTYPNPILDELNINYELLENSPVNISIFDLGGRKIATLFSDNQLKGKYHLSYNVSTLDKGSYTIRIVTRKGVAVTTMIKQ